MSNWLQPLKKYSDFTGRAMRSEFWKFLAAICALPVLVLFAEFLFPASRENTAWAVFFGWIAFVLLLLLITGLPLLAVGARRLHDIDKTAWLLLFWFVPFGAFVLAGIMCLPGTKGANRYGPDPLSPNDVDAPEQLSALPADK